MASIAFYSTQNRTKDVALTDKNGYFSIDGIEAGHACIQEKCYENC